MIIQTTKLTKNYGKTRGITDVNLSVDEGEFFGFIGPNGAGKSTMIRTLLGLISPTSGSAEVFGMPLAYSSQYLKDIGYMPSEAMFYNNMRVGELIAFSAKMRKLNCSEESKKLCNILSLDTHKKIGTLSLGNRKKVGIVCALQHKPKLYILDEPTSGLDPLMQKTFFELLKERNKEGATIFFSSHILSEVQKNCNRAAIIREGKLVAVDSMESLSKSSAKRIVLSGINAAPQSLNPKSVEINDESVSFLYSGELKLLMSELNKISFSDIKITEPELEEVFMHYYEKGNE